MTMTVGTLSGGLLADVMAERMFETESLRDSFRGALGPEARARALVEKYRAFHGWDAPPELHEWARAAKGYGKLFDQISDVWTLEDTLGAIEQMVKSFEVGKHINNPAFVTTIVSGLELFGHDASGETCYISTLPNPNGVAEVHVYKHVNGKRGSSKYSSIADFVFECWSAGGTHTSADKQLTALFEKQIAAGLKRRPWYHDSTRLSSRSEWLQTLVSGTIPQGFAEMFAAAPDYATWERERALFASEAPIACYWMLAHFLLGNLDAAREAVDMAQHSPGLVAPALAAYMKRAIERNALGTLKGDQLELVRARVRKSCLPEQLEPAHRALALVEEEEVAAVEAKSGTITDAQLKAEIKHGKKPWDIIARYPHDTATHDRVLQHLLKSDRTLAPFIAQYFAHRTSDVHAMWPTAGRLPKGAWSTVVAAAFVQGLSFDAAHKKAYPALLNTLARIDDERAIGAFEEAVSALRSGDQRVEPLMKALEKSDHARAPKLLARLHTKLASDVRGRAPTPAAKKMIPKLAKKKAR